MPKGRKKPDKDVEEEEDIIWVPKEDTDWKTHSRILEEVPSILWLVKFFLCLQLIKMCRTEVCYIKIE